MNTRRLFTLCFFLLTAGIAIAQNRQITGKVIDANSGKALGGVTVTAGNAATVTKADGSYTISVNTAITALTFSYVSFTPQTIDLNGRTSLSVQLQPSQGNMDDVVVIGYGSIRKSSLTGAVSKFKNEKLDEAPVARLDQALQGRIAGVAIQNVTSEAGSAPRIRVRGLSSINAGAEPLVVVDGQPIPDGLAFVNSADVESVEVLKDAASAAIYGSRGANGVILITTKAGKTDKPTYTLKASYGVRNDYKRADLMSASEYVAQLFNEGALRAKDTAWRGTTNLVSTAERAQYLIEQQLLGGRGTDWQSEALRDATVSNIQLNVSGGKQGIHYYVSGAYQKEEGMMYHSNFDRANLRVKLDADLGKRVKISFNINPSYTKRERPSANYTDFIRFPSYIPVRLDATTTAFVNATYPDVRVGDFAQARYFNGRVYSGAMPDGSNWVNTATLTPFSTANNTPKSIMETRSLNYSDYRTQASGDMTINLAPGLNFKTSANAFAYYTEGLDFAKTGSARDGDASRGVYTNQLYIDLLSENTLNYNKKIKDHSFAVLAGLTAQKTNTRTAQTTATNFASDNITTINTALTIDQANTFTLRGSIGLVSLLGRVNYNYKDKYLLSASLRGDGSSFFGPGRKWGNFPAVSLGWVVSEEKFMQGIGWLSQLKLRGSYGETGNNRIVEFAYLDLLYAANYAFGTGTGTGTVATGQVPSRDILANPNISWETTYQYNFGADLGFLKNRITLTAEVYQSKTDRLLLRQAALGFTGVTQTWNNIGQVRNNGVEIELVSNNVKSKNFKWTTSVNLAHNKNKLLALGGEAFQLNTGERNEVYSAAVGYQTIRFFGYKTDGVWLSQAEADAAKAKDRGTIFATYFTAGGLKLQDLNGDGKITTDDRTDIGSPFPKLTYGINNSLNYKGFDLSFLIQGVSGVDLINGDANYNEARKYNRAFNYGSRWVSPANPGDGKTPYFTNGVDWMLTDYVVEKGDYWALREVIFGYGLPQRWTRRAHLSVVRLYTSIQNAYVHMAPGYRNINPEARSISAQYASPLIDGYQRGSFPIPRTVLLGLNINF